MSEKLFINYRRADDPGFVQALYFSLETAFQREDLFLDVEGYIKAGEDFEAVLQESVRKCTVFLAVIGPRWLDILNVSADAAKDFAVIEIEAALDQGKRVIPVLVGGAEMPAPGQLPKKIDGLGRRQAVHLRPETFAHDARHLIKVLLDMSSEQTVEPDESTTLGGVGSDRPGSDDDLLPAATS